ncbi:hypothetical protein MuYL_1685 [Mucilaginibacter xinganensis]|uniref:Uncharacterized protein n=1 Tax=Mucilaginibacter xinganensis TaxID=1234841 RepID=A0A223NVL1_9SPHI|nr:hypothetical protein MuYL_1685 [Mucilaginibacter xinganensis]
MTVLNNLSFWLNSFTGVKFCKTLIHKKLIAFQLGGVIGSNNGKNKDYL